MNILIPSVPHTRPTAAWSHCAFTTKTRLLPRLLKLAYPDARIVWFGVAGDVVEGCDDHVPVMSEERWASLFDASATAAHRFVGEQAHIDHAGYVAFNAALADEWRDWVQPGDLVCFPFGHAHQAAAGVALERGGVCVETGIGYPTPFLPFRIYESYAWLHYVAGKSGCEGSDYHFVAPHYYDLSEWPTLDRVRGAERKDVVYVGRLIESKGLHVLSAIADAMPEQSFAIYGQGDPAPFLRPNVRYGGVLDRAGVADTFLHAKAAVFPTRYIEPFCQSHVEALLCGCPVMASDFGVFPEMYVHSCGAVRTARALPQFVAKLREDIGRHPNNRTLIHLTAQQAFGLEAVAPKYRRILDTILETATPSGWYGEHFPTSRAAAA